MNEHHPRPITILMAEDDPDDRELAEEALRTAHVVNELKCVGDGQELLDYLLGEGEYAGAGPARPGVILLDLNMPRKDGREALKEIKANPDLRQIPVIILTTSKAEEDVIRSYDLGANSFITKPVTFGGLVDAMKAWSRYWFEIVELPDGDGNGANDD